MASAWICAAAAAKDGGEGGVFRRDVADGEWQHVLPGVDAHALTVDPRDPDTVYAGTKDGPYRSTDAGRTWRRLGFPDRGMQVWSVLIDPHDPRTVYAGGSPVAVYRSDDGGETFRRMPDPGLPDRVRMEFPCRVMRFAAHPRRPGELYATLEVNGAMRSTDGGESWQDCTADLLRLAERPELKSRILSDTDAEGMLDGHAVATSEADPDAVYLAVRMGLFRSDDAGHTWRNLEVGRFSPHTYGRDIRVSPAEPSVLYAALSVAARSQAGSLWRSDDLGQTWRRFDKVSPTGTVMGIALHPRDPSQVFMAARYGEVFGTTDGGATWQAMPLPGTAKDIYALACGGRA